MSEPPQITAADQPNKPRYSPQVRRVGGLLIVYLAVYLLIDVIGLKYIVYLQSANNSNIAEAVAMLSGSLVLPERTYDTAVVDGKPYNVFPPAFTLISALIVPLAAGSVPSTILVLMFASIPGLAYAVFLRRTSRIRTATLFTFSYLLGTSLLPIVNQALNNGGVWMVNHALSQIGLLIFLLDYYGRRRIWLGGLGLLLAAWSRQLTGFYVVAFIMAAWGARTGEHEIVEGSKPMAPHSGLSRGGRIAWVAVFAVVMVALPATLNTLKFGKPWDSGYRYVYERRWDNKDDWAAQRAKEGLFSYKFVPLNFYYMNLGFPIPDEPLYLLRFTPNTYGTGIWWTTPLLAFLPIAFRRIWANRMDRWLLISAALVYCGLMAYHVTGWAQLGYNRFSMDFLVVLLALIAPTCDNRKYDGWVLGLALWSIWYFRWAI